MKKAIAIIVPGLLIFAFGYAGEPLKTWDYGSTKDISFSVQQGCKAEMRISPDVKTPVGEKTLAISLNELPPKSVPQAIQLRFNYKDGLKAGHTYEVSFLCRADAPGKASLSVCSTAAPWTFLPNATMSLETSKEWKTVSFVFTVKEDISRPFSIPLIMLGQYGAPSAIFFGPAVLWDMKEKPGLIVKENMIFNSSFELDDAGYANAKHLYMPRNPTMKYEHAGQIDTTIFVSGKKSMKLSNPYGDEARLIHRELSLEPNTKYTLSVWLKAEKPATPVRVQMSTTIWAYHTMNAIVTTDWKRYSYTFETKKGHRNPYLLYIATGREPQASTASVWVDDIQLAQGDEKDYEAGSDIEAVCVPASNYYISENGAQKVAGVLKVVNNSGNTVNGKFAVIVKNDYNDNTVFTKDIALSLKPKECVESPVAIAVSAYGSYIIDVKDANPGLKCNSQISCFGVIGKYDVKPIDLDKTYCVSFNGSCNLTAFQPVLLSKPLCMRMSGCSPDEYVERLSMMGCRLIRNWLGVVWFRWSLIEPEDDKFDFKYADMGVELFARHGIRILPVLEPGLRVKEKPEYYIYPEPEWMKEMRRNSPVATRTSDYNQEIKLNILPEQQWRKYVHAVAEHFKGRITHYEIFNEPNLFTPVPEVYVDFLKNASDEIRKADPNARVVGFCSTGDMGGNVERFFEDCFKLDSLPYADIASWHPYFARELSSKLPADKQIADIKNLLAKYGKPDMPLWNTENYQVHGNGINSTLDNAHHAAQKFLMDLGEGVSQSISKIQFSVWRDVLTPGLHSEFHELRDDIDAVQPLPSPIYVAYNALARYFEGAKPIGKWRWIDSAVCYAYEKDGQYIAAIWNYRAIGGFQISLPANPDDIELIDMFGNKLPYNGQPVIIGVAPRYIKWKRATAASVRICMENAIIGGEQPFRIDRNVVLQDKGRVLLSVCNISGKKLDNATVIIDGGTAQFTTGIFAPMESKELEFPVTSSAAKMKVEITGAEKKFVSEEAPVAVKYIALEEGKASAVIPIEKSVIGKPASPEDFSASFAAQYEKNTVRLKVAVKDDKRSERGRGIWDEDAIQLYIDAFPLQAGMKYPEYTGTTFKIEISVRRDGDDKINANGFPGKIESVTRELNDGYELIVNLSLDGIPGFMLAKGTRIGFDISVEDSDGKSRKTELVWNGTANNYKDRSQFAIMEFK